MAQTRFDLLRLLKSKGKILGSAAGFAVGGPFGALIGVAAGHAIDNLTQTFPETDSNTLSRKQIEEAFGDSQTAAVTIGIIVLGAKMARENGRIVKRDLEKLMDAFSLPSEQARAIEQLFSEARTDQAEAEPYAEQLSRLFQDKPNILEELLNGLFRYALSTSDQISQGELAYLRRLSFIFGFSAVEFGRLCRAHGISANAFPTTTIESIDTNPFKILGLNPRASNDEIKQAWRQLIRENHPDQMAARNSSHQQISEATHRMASINAAYDEIRRVRGLN